MDSHEINKIFGAVLATVLVVLMVRIIGNTVFHEEMAEKPGYEIEVAEEGAAGAAQQEEEVIPLPVFLANASVDAGARAANKCAACHTFEEGGANKVGPNLYGIMGNKTAHLSDYAYSADLANANGTWGWEEMNAFLENPKAVYPGTKMSFAGLRKPEERANIMVYMNSLSSAPLALPAVEEAPAAAAEPMTTQPETPTDPAAAASETAPATEQPANPQ